MSNLSYSNIDRWLFELVEGNLSPEQIAQLESFLMQHPELDVDKDMWEMAKVDSHEVVYPHQQKFIKRRPVGIYMSLGFTFLAVVISLGFFNFYSSQSFGLALNTHVLASASENDFASSKIEIPVHQIHSNHPVYSEIQTSVQPFYGNKAFSKQGVNQPVSHEITNFNVLNNHDFEIKNSSFDEKEIDLASFETAKTQEIPNEISNKEFVSTPVSINNKVRFAKTDYKLSFSSKLSKMGRSIQRMMDNPVALKNTKDPHYHVPGMQALDVNFGAVGTLLATRVQTLSRSQWTGENNQQFTNQLSVDGYSYGMRGGIGFQLNQNYYGKGEIVNYNASLLYSPKFSIARNVVLEPSIRFKMGNKAINTDLIQPGTIV
jgi:hypothetical protein